MKLKRGYQLLLVAWLLLGLPSFILGWGFSEGQVVEAFVLSFEAFSTDPVSGIASLVAWAFLLSPFLLLPFAFERKPNNG